MRSQSFLVFALLVCTVSSQGANLDLMRPAAGAIVDEGEELRRVEVWLAEPVERIEGWDWGRGHKNGKPLMMTAIQEPAYVVVHLPSGKTLESYTNGATMNNDDGFVSKVVLQTLPELAKSYDEVVDAAEAIVRRWGIDNAELTASLARWREMYDSDPLLLDPDERYPDRSLKLYARGEIEFDIILSPERAIHYSNEGWYLQLNLYAGYAVNRKMGREVRKVSGSGNSDSR